MTSSRAAPIHLAWLAVLLVAPACRRVPADSGPDATTGDRRVANLRAFAKLYGYLRYFHPSDEAAAIDWDRLAVHGAGLVKDAGDAPELRRRLEQLFAPVAPTLRIFPSGHTPPAIPLPVAGAAAVPVAWQHVGHGVTSRQPAYRSGRTHRPHDTVAGGGPSFGTATMRVPAGAYRGKAVRLSALVKTDVSGAGNQGQLWLRVDRGDDVVGFFDNMDDRPITGRSWHGYEIRGRVDADATHIAFGGFLAGSGRVWLDDFHLETADGDGHWMAVPVENAGFEAQGEDARPWSTKSTSYEYRVVSEGAAEGKRALLIQHRRTTSDEALFAGGPALGELVTRELGAGLACRFPLVLPSENGHTLGGPGPPLAPLAQALAKVDLPALTADDERVRLADVVITWNVFQHFYPYFDVVRTDWDAVLGVALGRALADRNHAAFARTLRWLVAQIQDGHGRVSDRKDRDHASLPWKVAWVAGEVVVTAAEPATTLQRGDVVVTMNGASARATLVEAEQLISGSPQWRRLEALDAISRGPVGSVVAVTVRRGEQTRSVRLERREGITLPDTRRPRVEKLAGGIWYVDLDRAPWPEIASRLAEIAAAPGVIFDLRGYPKDNHTLIQHLLREPDRSAAWMLVPQIAYPDREKLVGHERHGWGLMPAQPHIQGKVAFITGPGAISYAESFMSFIEGYRLGAIVGQPTAGTNGNVNPFHLPGGFKVVWTGMKVVKHDGSQLHHVGVRPTVPVEPTLEGVRLGRDEAFEAALRLVSDRS
jgi:hypothetical protein